MIRSPHPHHLTQQRTGRKMDSIFQNENEESAKAPLQRLYETKSRHRIVVEKNEVKAGAIEKEFRKYFHIKK